MTKLSDLVQRSALRRAGRDATVEFLAGKVTLEASEILALHTSPVEIIPAPGHGKVIVLRDAYCVYRRGTTDYTTSQDWLDLIHPGMESAENAELGLSLTNVFEDGTDAARGFEHVNPAQYPPDAVENKSVILRAENADPTDGDGTLTITAYYTVVTLDP